MNVVERLDSVVINRLECLFQIFDLRFLHASLTVEIGKLEENEANVESRCTASLRRRQ